MRRFIPAYIGLAVSLLGTGLAASNPVTGFAVSTAGMIFIIIVLFMIGPLVPLTRALAVACAVSHGVAATLASGFWVLGLGAMVLALSLVPYEAIFRKFGHAGSLAPFGIMASLAVMTSPFVEGPWRWSPLPLIAWAAFLTKGGIADVKRMDQSSLGGWRVKIGELVPDIHLFSRDNQTEFQLSRERGRFVLLCFLRGDWCPACHMMMRIYKREAVKLAAHGVKLVAISPSAGSEAEDFAKVIGVDYLLLADPDCKAAQMFGAIIPKAFKGQDVPLPASFLLDTEGILRFASVPQNATAFLDPARVIDILEQRKGQQAG